MALLTELPLASAIPLARAFGLELARVEALTAGSVNSNFRLTDTTGKVFFARLYEEQDHAGAVREHALVAALGAAGVPVVRALTNQEGGSLADFDGKAFAVFPWVEGEILCQGRVTAAACRELGAAYAHPCFRPIEPVMIDAFHAAGLLVMTPHTNDPLEARYFAELGVDVIASDDPRILRPLTGG